MRPKLRLFTGEDDDGGVALESSTVPMNFGDFTRIVAEAGRFESHLAQRLPSGRNPGPRGSVRSPHRLLADAAGSMNVDGRWSIVDGQSLSIDHPPSTIDHSHHLRRRSCPEETLGMNAAFGVSGDRTLRGDAIAIWPHRRRRRGLGRTGAECRPTQRHRAGHLRPHLRSRPDWPHLCRRRRKGGRRDGGRSRSRRSAPTSSARNSPAG